MLITLPTDQKAAGNPVPDMDLLAVNYLVKTPGGSVYHGGDSHFSNMYAKHGKTSTRSTWPWAPSGRTPRDYSDKQTASDILRMAEGLNAKVVIPFHHDIWSNFSANPGRSSSGWEMKRHALNYSFVPYIWQVGGKFVFPENKDDREYHYPRGFSDAFKLARPTCRTPPSSDRSAVSPPHDAAHRSSCGTRREALGAAVGWELHLADCEYRTPVHVRRT